MRILASFKVTPDYEALRPADWTTDAADGPETRYVRRILNCFDESALELALRLAEDFDGHAVAAELGALSIGGPEVESHLKTLQALGWRRTARVDAGVALDFAPGVTAALIAAYVHRVDRSDLLLLGSRSGPGDSGTVPFLVAERLGWPCLPQVTDIEALPDGRVRATSARDDGPMNATLRLPCVLAVGNAAVSHLRVPTLTQRLACRDTPIDVVDAAALDVDVTAGLRREAAPASLEIIDRTRPGVVIDGATPREKAQALYDAHLRPMLEML